MVGSCRGEVHARSPVRPGAFFRCLQKHLTHAMPARDRSHEEVVERINGLRLHGAKRRVQLAEAHRPHLDGGGEQDDRLLPVDALSDERGGARKIGGLFVELPIEVEEFRDGPCVASRGFPGGDVHAFGEGA